MYACEFRVHPGTTILVHNVLLLCTAVYRQKLDVSIYNTSYIGKYVITYNTSVHLGPSFEVLYTEYSARNITGGGAITNIA